MLSESDLDLGTDGAGSRYGGTIHGDGWVVGVAYVDVETSAGWFELASCCGRCGGVFECVVEGLDVVFLEVFHQFFVG